MALIAERYERTHGKPALRDQHPKSHGCVTATFVVTGVPSDLRRGLFAKPGPYPAVVRFSASFARPRSDRWPDAHGMAIKVFCSDGRVQDFVLANYPVFFVADATDYVALLHGGLVTFVGTRPRELVNLLRATMRPLADPLTADYYSQTPFACGSHAVKYCAFPPSEPSRARPRAADALAVALVQRLRSASASFGFALQRRGTGEPIDDARVRWRRPFDPVGRIEIPAQVPFDGDYLAFSPGNCLPEHAPLGSVNAVRVGAYRYVADRRRALNDPDWEASCTQTS